MKRIFPSLLIICLTAFLAACSTTKRLPEGEQLYVGIEKTDYVDDWTKRKHKKRPDSTGVITSIASAVKAVDRFVSSDGPSGGEAPKSGAADGSSGGEAPSSSGRQRRPRLSKAQRDSLRRAWTVEREAFEQARAEVDAVLAYPPNGAIFGSSSLRWPWQPGLWFYNGFVNRKKKLGRWVFRKFAKEPVLLSTVNPDTRIKVATNTLHNYGFFRGAVGYDVVTQKNPKKAKLAYNVKTGRVFRYDSIAYVGFWPAADSLIRASRDASLLHRGDAFNVTKLTDEQKRIENLLRNNGHYYYAAGYATYRADTTQKPRQIQLQMLPTAGLDEKVKKRWYIGHTYITLQRKAGERLDQKRTWRNRTFLYSGEKMPLKPVMWLHAITQRHGDLYRLDDQNMTQEKINAIGVFSQMDINYMPRDTSERCDTLDLYVNAVMDKLYDSNFEVSAQLKSNQQVGPALTYGLAKRNAFRGGEKVSFDIYGSYEWQTGAGAGRSKGGLLNSYELGTKLALEFPRFLLPRANRRRFRFPATTTYSLDANWKNRASFFNMFSLGLSAAYQWHKTSTSRHELTAFSLDYDQVLHSTQSFDSIMNANPALYSSMRNQFIPSISYTYTYTSPAGTRHPLWWQSSIKEAGNVVSALYAAAGQPFRRKDKELFGNPFAQFVKVTTELHKTFRLGPALKLATRFYGGAIFSYGNASRAPYSEQFYVGGANSIRGFAVRSVGPGRYHSPSSQYAYTDQTGDIRLEANAELRFPLFGSLYGATFIDVGNVWLARPDSRRPDAEFSLRRLKDVAVGTGAGLRYDLDFLVLRFDVGVALHAPYDTGRSGWYNIPRFKNGLAYHLAIGYPF